jgi:hypothetical protein
MLTLSLFVRLEAKRGKEEAVAAFLMQGLQLANQESTTPLWFALRLGPTTFAIFDAFAMKPPDRPIWTGPLPRRSWRMPQTCSRRPRRFSAWTYSEPSFRNDQYGEDDNSLTTRDSNTQGS